MLEIKNLKVNYAAITALHGVSLTVRAGGIVTLIGSNGAGKTTTLKTISGLLKPKSGEIIYDGRNIAGLPPHEIVKRGLSHVPEGRMIFANLTVLENLQMGAYLVRDKKAVRRELEFVFTTFPRLKERDQQIAGTLSGGEQQMLAEPSLGLAPLLVKTIFEKIVEINRERGLTILLVEQNANRALEISSFGYVLETGKITLQGDSVSLRQKPQVKSAYLGGN